MRGLAGRVEHPKGIVLINKKRLYIDKPVLRVQRIPLIPFGIRVWYALAVDNFSQPIVVIHWVFRERDEKAIVFRNA